ncbi:MAG: aldehyde:ferredoxin oxidoreductase [Thermoanaerobacteraceae bacterium]|nr:aldehyde:ferredoxin oxidoreductase [Thermoanaerobacteraceae bacterium]
MYSWTGNILRINLTDGTSKVEPLDVKDARMYLGGRGLGTKIMMDEVDPKVDPLGPENKLIFAAGVLTGTIAPSSGRYMVITKGPLNGTIASSNSGGFFGAELKYAGFDAVIIEGKASKPVYVYIYNDRVEIRDAGEIWGKTVPDTTDMIREQTDEDAKIACIGPAGENLVRIACIMNEMNRAAGRSGVGAVMGSKNLKALAVRGTKGIKIADDERFMNAVMKARKMIFEHPVGGTGLPTYGTAVLVNILNESGGLPVRNFRDSGVFPTADKTGGETLAANHLIRNKGCYSCVIRCGRVTRVTNPKFKGIGEGPEYEPAWAYGADCGIDNLDAIIKANFLCNELGLDAISMPTTIACAMELYEEGYITQKETGCDLRFGNVDAIVDLTRKTAYKEGFGKELAEGSYRMAEKYGHPELSMSVKKQEMPAYEPRAIQGIGLNYATSNRGGCHVRGYTISPEILGVPEKIDPREIESKPQWVVAFQNLTAAVDSSGFCLFSTFGLDADIMAEIVAAATGLNLKTEDFVKIGERVWNLEKMFNLQAGFSKKDDTLPPRILQEPLKFGPHKGQVHHLDKMLPEYYKNRGWDKDGIPTRQKAEELQLADYHKKVMQN